MNFSQKDRTILIKTIWGEARGETALGKMAVCWVILNRVARPQWGNSIESVCLQPWQFSCWNKNDPNRKSLERLNLESNDPTIQLCRDAVDLVLGGKASDPTNGADHYYADWINTPSWARGKKASATIGAHKFFNLHPPTKTPNKGIPIKEEQPVDLFYFLDFTMGLDTDGRLEDGRLVLRSLSKQGGRTHQIWVSTTSTANKQQPEDFHQRGGPIPPEYRVPNLKAWEVELKPIYLPQKGIEGNFYKILPFAVKTDKGGDRSDLGIHLDGNVPGSLGCIVMTKPRFQSFEAEMKRLRELGYKKLPLFVTYSTN